jgi:phage anti-repressor protein
MRKREDLALSRHCINLYYGDYPKLQALYSTRVGAAKIIRDIIHAHIRKVEETAAQRTRPLTVDDAEEIEMMEQPHEH